jgi:SprT protein
MRLKFKEILTPYLPPQTLDQVADFLIAHKIQLKITRNRNSKLGDYRPPGRVKAHRITINGTLNPYYFYIVFLHELAHLLVWVKHQHRVSPHGKHWKEEFSTLLKQGVQNGYFPDDLGEIILDYSRNVKATFASSGRLWKYLNNDNEVGGMILEDIPVNSYFMATNGRIFRKEQKLRTRYRCYCLNNKRRYLFHQFASIKLVDKDDLPLTSIL